MWRKKGKELHQKCSTKGKKEGTVECMAKFMVVISHGRGVIESFPYEGNINGELFSQFVRDRFSNFFTKGNNHSGCLVQPSEHSDPPPSLRIYARGSFLDSISNHSEI